MHGKLTHKDLEMLRSITTTGSLTATARQLHVSQPAISQRLATLTDRLGTALFLRRDGGMQPTPVAERLAEAGATIGRILDQAMDDVCRMLDERQRQLRITTQCHTSYRWLSFVIRDLNREHPELAVDVVPEAIEDPYGAIERGVVDIALVFAPRDDAAVRTIDLFADEMFAVMNAKHPLAGRKFLNADNFANEALILYTGKRHAFVDQVLTPAGVTPGRLRQVRMTEAIVELARSGQGIAVLAGWVLNDLGSRHGLRAVRIGRGGFRRQWRAIVSEQCPDQLGHSFIDSVRHTASAMQHDNWRDRLEAA